MLKLGVNSYSGMQNSYSGMQNSYSGTPLFLLSILTLDFTGFVESAFSRNKS